jgi:hypothetical protein
MARGFKDTHNQVVKRYIYHLVDPRNSEVFYVGQTVDPGQRLQDHIKSRAAGKAKVERLDAILSSGLYPVMKTVTAVTGTYSDACRVEQSEINTFPIGQLTNTSNAGKILRRGAR